MLHSHNTSGSKDLKRAPKPVVNKERAWKVWEEAESSRASGNANFFKTLRNNRTAIIVGLIAAALIFFRLQEATCVPMMCFFQNKKLLRFGRAVSSGVFQTVFHFLSRYKDDRRLKKDSKAEDDPFTLLGLQQGASASQVLLRDVERITPSPEAECCW